jgi:predicted NAD-dependent protein-ADP-ribosyltransferase YbiA (DUF1768 family)
LLKVRFLSGFPLHEFLIFFSFLSGTPSVSEDLNQTISHYHEAKKSKLAEKEKINEYIAREKALRHQKELGRQLKILQRQIDDKSKEMNYIQTQYNL